MLIVINRFFRPELCSQFLLGNNITIAFSDGSKHTKGLAPQIQFKAVFSYFFGVQIHFEHSETEGARPLRRIVHGC
jgi:hypothetical protein